MRNNASINLCKMESDIISIFVDVHTNPCLYVQTIVLTRYGYVNYDFILIFRKKTLLLLKTYLGWLFDLKTVYVSFYCYIV